MRRLARVADVTRDADGDAEAVDLGEKRRALRERVRNAAPLGEVGAAHGPAAVGRRHCDVAAALAHAEQVVRADVAADDLREEVVERAVRVRDEEDALPGEGVVQVGDELHSHVRLARAGRPDDKR